MPWIADILPEPPGHADHDRRDEAVRRAPAQRATVVELFRCRIGVLAELNLRDRHESRDRHADGPPDDSLFGEAGVEHAIRAETLLKALGHEMHSAFHADVLAEDEHLAIALELDRQRPANRIGEADHFALLGDGGASE